MLGRIVAHDDFDGAACAAIVSAALGIDSIVYTGPKSIEAGEFPIDDNDVVVDLPYPLTCGMWFDHHAGNRENLELRGLDPDGIPGRFKEAPSCARVVYGYFLDQEDNDLPAYFEELVAAADKIDSFDYASVDEWREETPAHIVDWAIKAPSPHRGARFEKLAGIARLMRDVPLDEVAAVSEIVEWAGEFHDQERKTLDLISGSAAYHPGDEDRRLVILDMTRHRRPPRIIKNLAFLQHSRAEAVLEINNRMRRGVKTNDLTFSISLNLFMSRSSHSKDLGEIMRTLNIGDGHPGAAAGSLDCGSKNEMLRLKQDVADRIVELYLSM